MWLKGNDSFSGSMTPPKIAIATGSSVGIALERVLELRPHLVLLLGLVARAAPARRRRTAGARAPRGGRCRKRRASRWSAAHVEPRAEHDRGRSPRGRPRRARRRRRSRRPRLAGLRDVPRHLLDRAVLAGVDDEHLGHGVLLLDSHSERRTGPSRRHPVARGSSCRKAAASARRLRCGGCRSSSAGQSTALVKRGPRVRIPSPASCSVCASRRAARLLSDPSNIVSIAMHASTRRTSATARRSPSCSRSSMPGYQVSVPFGENSALRPHPRSTARR